MEITGTVAEGTRIRVAFSGERARAHSQEVAQALENILGAEGSVVQAQRGRWKGIIEEGYVVDCVTEKAYSVGLIQDVGRRLQPLVKETRLTFYVTAEQVLAMEVF